MRAPVYAEHGERGAGAEPLGKPTTGSTGSEPGLSTLTTGPEAMVPPATRGPHQEDKNKEHDETRDEHPIRLDIHFYIGNAKLLLAGLKAAGHMNV